MGDERSSYYKIYDQPNCTPIRSLKPRIHERVEWFANQMRVCVDVTANMRCTICERFAYHSLWPAICRFLEQTQRELDAPPCIGIVCSHQVREKLINCAPLTRCTQKAQCVSGALVYTKLKDWYTYAN